MRQGRNLVSQRVDSYEELCTTDGTRNGAVLFKNMKKVKEGIENHKIILLGVSRKGMWEPCKLAKSFITGGNQYVRSRVNKPEIETETYYLEP